MKTLSPRLGITKDCRVAMLAILKDALRKIIAWKNHLVSPKHSSPTLCGLLKHRNDSKNLNSTISSSSTRISLRLSERLSRNILFKRQKLTFGALNVPAIFHQFSANKPTNTIMSLMLSHYMVNIRPLSFLEQKLLQASTILPSILSSINQPKLESYHTKILPKETAVITTSLFSGEFQTSSASDFLYKLEEYHKLVNKRLEDLKSFGARLLKQEIDSSFAMIDGKVAVRGNSIALSSLVIPQLSSTVPWVDSWTVVEKDNSESSTDVSLSFSNLSEECRETSPGNSQDFEELDLHNYFNHLTKDELSVFSWS